MVSLRVNCSRMFVFCRGVESFFCEECGQGFQLRASLQKHLVNRHENEPKIYICDVADCKVSYNKRIYLTNHKINYHKIERKYLCQVSMFHFMLSNKSILKLVCHNNYFIFIGKIGTV